MIKPVYTIFAGVNGAGKSTLFRKEKKDLGVRINADEILKSNGDDSNDLKAQMKAGRQAVRLINECLKNKISFNQETTLAGRTIIKYIEKAKILGFEIDLKYVFVSTADMAVKRVENRVKNGGHNIPEEVIRDRYVKSQNNLRKILPLCDKFRIIDNSESHKDILIFDKDIIYFDEKSEWLKTFIKEKSNCLINE